MGLILSLDNSIHSFNIAGFVGLLDQYTGAAAGYSLRKLSVNTTNVVRVRRSSDNAEDDFTADEITDGTLLAWVGITASDNGFVTTWYDQSGNGNNATQGTAANQPKIVDAGVLVEENGKPAILSNDKRLVNSTLNTSVPRTEFFVFKPEGFNATFNNYYDGDGTINQRGYFGTDNQSPKNDIVFDDVVLTAYNSDTLQKQVTILRNGANSEVYKNSSLEATGNSGSNSTFVGLSIGRDFLNAAPSNIKYQELIIFDTDQSSNRVGIEGNINNHYNIYP